MHIMKIKGSGKIPDYIQIRDNNFALISYFKASTFEKSLIKDNLGGYTTDVAQIIDKMNFGELYYIENKDKA